MPQEIGVIAVVKELQKFLGDMGRVNGALNGLRPSASAIQVAFEAVGGAISNFGASVARVVETALGVMLRDAIEGIIRSLGDLLNSVVETGAEFQTLKIRLTGLNLNDFADGTRDFASAMSMAGEKTNEELDWLQTLGAATPFDPAQIADTYTQARAFGFAADEAQRLTFDIINYTAGMGLSNDTMFLVIQNLGQMVQRGKITGTEIRDLARGSFLPLNDVLTRIAANMGITVEALTQQISTPAGVPASEFVKAFEQMVEEEPRFVGAAGRLARAFVPATQNVKELLTSIFGLNVVTPLFDVLGEKVASVVDIFVNFNQEGDLVKTQRWEDLVAAASNLGKVFADLISQLLGFIPTGESMADSLILGINRLTVWITNNREKIVGFFQNVVDKISELGQWVYDHREDIINFFTGIGDVISNTIIPFVQNQLIPAFQQISQWVTDNGPMIQEFFGTLGQIVTDVFSQLFGGEFGGKNQDALTGFLDTLKTAMQWIIDNKDKIADWVAWLIRAWAIVQVLILVFNIFIGVLIFVAGIVMTVIGVLALLATPIGALIVAVAVLAAQLIMNWGQISTAASQLWFLVKYFFTQLWLDLVRIFSDIWTSISTTATKIWNSLKDTFGKMVTDIKNIDWGGIGRSIIDGISNGIRNSASIISNAARDAARSAYNAALSFLGIHSPSTLFMEVGALTMEGFSQGIEKYAAVASKTMGNAMSRVAAPAIAMPAIIQSVVAGGSGSTVSNTDTRNYNLTVNSGANTEPIISDFNMLSSMAG